MPVLSRPPLPRASGFARLWLCWLLSSPPGLRKGRRLPGRLGVSWERDPGQRSGGGWRIAGGRSQPSAFSKSSRGNGVCLPAPDRSIDLSLFPGLPESKRSAHPPNPSLMEPESQAGGYRRSEERRAFLSTSILSTKGSPPHRAEGSSHLSASSRSQPS